MCTHTYIHTHRQRDARKDRKKEIGKKKRKGRKRGKKEQKKSKQGSKRAKDIHIYIFPSLPLFLPSTLPFCFFFPFLHPPTISPACPLLSKTRNRGRPLIIIISWPALWLLGARASPASLGHVSPGWQHTGSQGPSSLLSEWESNENNPSCPDSINSCQRTFACLQANTLENKTAPSVFWPNNCSPV